MTGLWIAGLIGWLVLLVSFLAIEPVTKFLVKNRWAIERDEQ